MGRLRAASSRRLMPSSGSRSTGRRPPLPRQSPHPLQDPRGFGSNRPRPAECATCLARHRERAAARLYAVLRGRGSLPATTPVRPGAAPPCTAAYRRAAAVSSGYGEGAASRRGSRRVPATARDCIGTGTGGERGCGPGPGRSDGGTRGRRHVRLLAPYREEEPSLGPRLEDAPGGRHGQARGRRIRAFPVASGRIV